MCGVDDDPRDSTRTFCRSVMAVPTTADPRRGVEAATTASARTITTHLTGRALLGEPTLNKGTAFSIEERRLLGLEGLLPSRVETIDDQCLATRDRYDDLDSDMARHIFLRALEDTNEVLFYAFLERHLEELMPIVYTPTVGDACRRFSHIYRRPHGLFVSYEERDRMAQHLRSVDGPVDVIVVTDGERVLGLGDQGMGGMGIPIGKLALYTAVGGLDPRRTLPVLLDVGTNNQELLDDPMYLGVRHERVTGDDYHRFVDEFVRLVTQRFPGAVLQWEDFGGHHAHDLLEAHRDHLPSFNDDIQGTAAVALATVRTAGRAAGLELGAQRICIVGAGAAGCGIAEMIHAALRADGVTDPHACVALTDEHGLVHRGRTDLVGAQRRLAVDPGRFTGEGDGRLDHLPSVVAAFGATTLIGVSGVGGLFDAAAVRALTPGPTGDRIVLPLSNPTSKAEATPTDVLAWTDGRAVVATGSPFEPVPVGGERRRISQANNVYVFPGLGLGAVAARATAVTDAMVMAAADELVAVSPGSRIDGVLPPLADVAAVSRRIAVAVAHAAIADGVSPLVPDQVADAVAERVFTPVYPALRPATARPT